MLPLGFGHYYSEFFALFFAKFTVFFFTYYYIFFIMLLTGAVNNSNVESFLQEGWLFIITSYTFLII